MMATALSDHGASHNSINSINTIDAEGLFPRDLLDDTLDSTYVCGNCDEFAPATSRCQECNEALCDSCVQAHIRVKLTKDHHISPLNEDRSSPGTKNETTNGFSLLQKQINDGLNNLPSTLNITNHIESSRPGLRYCFAHPSERLIYYCDTCARMICLECRRGLEHRNHNIVTVDDRAWKDYFSNESLKYYTEITEGVKSLYESLENGDKWSQHINKRARHVTNEIRISIGKLKSAIEDREKELLLSVEKFRLEQQKKLGQKIDKIKSNLTHFSHACHLLTEAMETGTVDGFLYANRYARFQVRMLRSFQSPLVEETIVFTYPDGNLYPSLSTQGEVSCVKSTPPSGLFEERPNETPRSSGINSNFLFDADEVNSLWFSSSFRPSITMGVQSFVLPSKSLIQIPKSSSKRPRDYTSTSRPCLIFGGEGENDGQLCRPWGICCDQDGNIVVADRSNNRIQIYTREGVFLRKFGSHGSEPGNFDRPAGVACDPLGRIVVTDKDNHRVQVFTVEGKFIFTFGEKGSKVGQFNYPWDVDVDSSGRIVVSDTRNHRIQLFGSDGSFISKYGFESSANMWKHFDSPRGICFGSKGCVIVTDFNNHRLVVIDANFRNARFLGTEGSGVKQFLRPQGVAVDFEGNIIVADSRNNRIQVFEPNGGFLWQFGEQGKEPGQMDRPSGVCLTPDGNIAVVDFGNNRIQIF